MYKYEICFKGGHKLEFESYLKPSEIVKKLAPIVFLSCLCGSELWFYLPQARVANNLRDLNRKNLYF